MNRIATREAPNAEDRELLEVILDAIQLKCKWSAQSGFERYDTGEPWNPLTDDGDALRLAVRLGILGLAVAELDQSVNLGCAYENARRAIVRTAAAIVKQHSHAKIS